MASRGRNLTPRQHTTITHLLAAPSVEEGARGAGVPVRSVYRWLTDGAFCDALEAARGDARGRVVDALQTAALGAVRVLVEISNDKSAPPGARVAACKAILERVVSPPARVTVDATVTETGPKHDLSVLTCDELYELERITRKVEGLPPLGPEAFPGPVKVVPPSA